MKELAYVNGLVSDVKDAYIHIEDRGYQFGEGVYEVIKVYNGKTFALKPHLDRLARSSAGMEISFPWSIEFLEKEVNNLLVRSDLKNANIYMQVTSGTAPRSHLLEKEPDSSLIITIRKATETKLIREIKLITVEDIRWKKCWIKSTILAANIMAKKTARLHGAGEVVMYESDGSITEGGSSNIFAFIKGVLVTPDLASNILAGITRDIVLKIAKDRNLSVREGTLLLSELETADEIFITSTTFEVTAVIKLNDLIISDGMAGPNTRQMYSDYKAMIEKEC